MERKRKHLHIMPGPVSIYSFELISLCFATVGDSASKVYIRIQLVDFLSLLSLIRCFSINTRIMNDMQISAHSWP